MSFLSRKKATIINNNNTDKPSQAGVVDFKSTSVGLIPLMSEKSTRLNGLGQYTFIVNAKVSKIEVKKAIERAYGVRVVGVNSVRLPRKNVTRGRVHGTTKIRHHMIVRLAKGQTLQSTKAV
jgi:large subunit ribosomal protein L23